MATEALVPGGLLRHHLDFRRLWIGDAISQLGTRISLLALPLAAILTLHASTVQVAVLTALETAAFLVLGLPAGAWCDGCGAGPCSSPAMSAGSWCWPRYRSPRPPAC